MHELCKKVDITLNIKNQIKQKLEFLFTVFQLSILMKLSTLILALFTVASHLTVGSTQGTFDLIANFREPKNILFACNIGGSSHIVWVLEILEELAARGHHVSFYTRVSVKSKQRCILMVL